MIRVLARPVVVVVAFVVVALHGPAVVGAPADATTNTRSVQGEPTYEPPLVAPVVDGFRLPNGPFRAGNRGIEYSTSPGSVVRAIGDGTVTFSGRVAGTRHVTLLHGDGLRSSYSFLGSLLVRRGDEVVLGEPIGRTAARFHLGVRDGKRYIDPAGLFRVPQVRWRVRLIARSDYGRPGPGRSPFGSP